MICDGLGNLCTVVIIATFMIFYKQFLIGTSIHF